MVSQIFKFSGYLEPEEVRAVIGAVGHVSKNPERDQLLFELLWQSGARVSEAVVLGPERIGSTSIVFQNLKQMKKLKGGDGRLLRDEEGKPIKVRDEGAVKEVEVSSSLCQNLKDFCDRHSIREGEYIFKANRGKGHLSRWYVWWVLTKASELARVYRFGKRNPRTGGRFKGAFPHLFRHSNAMYLLDETGDLSLVQEQLGHSDIKTTQGYAHIKKPKIKKEIARIEW